MLGLRRNLQCSTSTLPLFRSPMKIYPPKFNHEGYATSAIKTKDDWETMVMTDKFQKFPPSPLPTYYFQKSLPRLPIPKLPETLDRYLACVENILPPNEFLQTKRIVQEFQNTVGPKLHDELLKTDKALKNTSYISGPWFEMYLKDRQPLPINYNPALVFVEDPVIDSLPMNQRQLVKATNLLVSSLRFMKSLDEEILAPEVYHMNPRSSDTNFYRTVMKAIPEAFATYGSYLFKAFPLDMSQYTCLFRSTRIPKTNIDQLKKGDSSVKHIVIMHRGHFYSCPVLDNDGNILPVSELMGSLESVLNQNPEPEKYPIGLMTTQDRNKWADIREHLVNKSFVNQKSLDEIDTALFVLCLDDDVLENDYVGITRSFLHSDGTNRWFDKSFQMILSKDAWAGVTFEHAWGDGVAVLRFFNDINNDTKLNQWSNSSTPKSPFIPPVRLAFDIDEKVKEGINEAKKRYESQCQSLRIHPFIFEKYGKKECKKWKISPDSLMQLGFQAAYYRMYGHTPATYESCSTAAFRHGRTETIRPATSYTRQVSTILSSGNWVNQKIQLQDLIAKCSETHNKLTKEAAMGNGFDRHLFALKTIAQKKNMELHDIFKDKTYGKINYNVVSTSTLASPAVRIGAFGPVVQDGFGLGYQIWDGGLGCVTGTYKGGRDGSAFVETCHKVFTDLQTILEYK